MVRCWLADIFFSVDNIYRCYFKRHTCETDNNRYLHKNIQQYFNSFSFTLPLFSSSFLSLKSTSSLQEPPQSMWHLDKYLSGLGIYINTSSSLITSTQVPPHLSHVSLKGREIYQKGFTNVEPSTVPFLADQRRLHLPPTHQCRYGIKSSTQFSDSALLEQVPFARHRSR